MTHARNALVLAATLILSACTLIPPYQRPAAPVPDRFPRPMLSPLQGPAQVKSVTPRSAVAPPGSPQLPIAPDIASRDFFADAQLNSLIALALQNNRDLRIAVLNVEQSRAQYQITRSALFPTVQGSGSYTKEYISLSSEIPGFPASGGITSNTWSSSVGINSYELDLFGHVRSQDAQALEQYFSTEEAQRAAQVSLVGEVATEYFTLREAQAQLRLAHNTLDSVQGSYDLNKVTFDAGASNELDLRQSEGQVETAQLSVRTYELQLAQARDDLQLLLGTVMPADLPPARPFSATGMMAQIPAGLPSQLIARRPDILEAEHTLEAANANIGVARAAFFPTISLTGSVGTTGEQLTSLFKFGNRTWSFSPQISVPIFTGGKNRAQLDSARVAERIQVATYEKAIQTAFREVADALAETDNYAQQIILESALIATQQRRLDLATLRYRHGADTYLNELEAQQDLYSAQQGLLQAQFNELSSQVALYQALGGGWK